MGNSSEETFQPLLGSAEQALLLLRRMQLIRVFEERVRNLSASGAVPGLVHLCSGQEAVAVGVCSEGISTSETYRHYGITGEIAATIAEVAFDWFDAPVVRIGAENVPIPFSKALEPLVLPDPSRLASSLTELVRRH